MTIPFDACHHRDDPAAFGQFDAGSHAALPTTTYS